MWRSFIFFLAFLVSKSWQIQFTNFGNYNPYALDSGGINKDALTALSLLAASPGLFGGGGATGGFGAGGGGFGGAPFPGGPKGPFFGGKAPTIFVPVPRKEPVYLTCKNSAVPNGQSVPSVVVATIGDYSQGYGTPSDSYSSGAASGSYGAASGSYSAASGSYGAASGPAYGGGSYGGGNHASLSLDVTVKANGVSGPAQVVFTTQGAVSTGCYADNLGRIYNPGQKQASNPYANFLIGFGPPGPVGYGAPQGQSQYPGVVTSITLYPDRPSNAHADSLSIEDLNDLAGRGLAVVSSVSYDGYGQTVMDGKIIACCSLSYDNRPRDLGVSVAAAGGFPSASPGVPPPGPAYPQPSPPGASYPATGPAGMPLAYPGGASPPAPAYPGGAAPPAPVYTAGK